jgi:N-acetylneuraminic acid mutarotase
MQSHVNSGPGQTSLSTRALCGLKSHTRKLRRFVLGLGVLLVNLLIIWSDAVAASFSNAAPLITARGGQTATLISNGKLLITGGVTNGAFTSATVELYDPNNGTWTEAGSMNSDRAHHTAIMLPNGKILVAGGQSSANGALSSAELYDPITGSWTTTGSMAAARYLHTATLLAGGQVLVAGGTADGSAAISQAELYDPVIGAWTTTNSPNSPRFSHTATLLPNGQVLIAGGTSGGGNLVTSAELLDPSTGTWTTTNSLISPRYSHTATLLPNGQVLACGGTTDGSTALSSAEWYNPSLGTWTATNSLNTARFNHTASLLPNGSALVIGGTPDGSTSVTNAEVFNFNTGTWTVTGPLNAPRYSHTATLVANGEVLIVGGFNTNRPLFSVERFNPAAGTWTRTGFMPIAQTYLTQTLLANGKALVLGGGSSKAQLYDPSSGTWLATSPMSVARFSPSVTLLSNRKVLVAGGDLSGAPLATAELYDPVPGTWTPTALMHQAREYHSATLLPGGYVLVAGGLTAGRVSLKTAELFNPSTGAWIITGPLNDPRAGASAILLPNGKVLVAGGFSGTTNLTSAELYDPDSGTWTMTGPLSLGRENVTATLLPNGKVLFAGGYGDTGAVAVAELYDPAIGTWTGTASLPGPRYDHTATLLANGMTLIAGGSNGRNAFSSALLYDAPSETWRTTAPLSFARAAHAACLLASGKVLVAGGTGTATLSSAELYDPGLGFRTSWQPQIASAALLSATNGISISGSGFRGVSEASSGNSQDSPTDFPVIELMSLDNGQLLFLPATNWSSNVVASPPVSGLPPGYLMATVFVNAIPSAGQIFKIPSPPAIANLPATAIGTNAATINGLTLDTGGATPSVTVYYGTNDGGTNQNAWSNSIALGLQSDSFGQMLNGLSTNTTYYFTAKAVNSAGTSWAMPSLSFTTVTLPLLTNLPATGVQGTFATLNGEVLFTGHDTPSVTIYYGTKDGGTDPSAWAYRMALGLEGGWFEQTILGLATSATYFYTAEAVNSAGMNWATPSQSFTTAASNSLSASVAVLTHHNDNGRTGMNLNEFVLNPSNVRPNTFGLLCTRPVDDQIYAQPLVMTNVNVLGRGTRNIVIVATVNDTLYAYDADDPTITAPYWTNSFIAPPNIAPPNNADESALGACGGLYQDFSGKFGIVGTPVIDPSTGTLYLVARTKEFGTNFVQRLHALDLTTGLDRSNSPVVITASYPGTGAGSVGGMVPFDPVRNNQRPALTLANGVVYLSWSSHCDNGPYHGWVIGYNAGTLQQVAVFNDTPNGSEAGIWMSGQGPSADASGNIYLTTGNGSVGGNNYGESFLKLSLTSGNSLMSVPSYFIPLNWQLLNNGDIDLGSAGLLLIPGTQLAISGGKQSVLYLVERDNMGGITNAVQSWSLNGGEIHGGPVWWTAPNGSFMYVWPDSGSRLRQYLFTNGAFNTTPFAQSATIGGSGSPGGILAVSANGNGLGSGILWAVVNTASDANQAVVPGTLHAYDAQNVGAELWNSDMHPRDSLGKLAKFVPPTVANGKVYMATFSGRLNVYGLLPSMLPPSSGSNGITINFAGSPGLTYTLQRADAVTGPWTSIISVTIGGGGLGTYLDGKPATGTAFYRITYP